MILGRLVGAQSLACISPISGLIMMMVVGKIRERLEGGKPRLHRYVNPGMK